MRVRVSFRSDFLRRAPKCPEVVHRVGGLLDGGVDARQGNRGEEAEPVGVLADHHR